MSFYIDDKRIRLESILERIKETDLVPGRIKLLDDISGNFKKLEKSGLKTLNDLRKTLKNLKKIDVIAENTDIDSKYLTLLRREIESYFPKIRNLRNFSGIDNCLIEKLENMGYKNNKIFYEEFEVPEKYKELIESYDPDKESLDRLYALTGLTRIQWVSPIFAEMLFDSGYKDVYSIAEAVPERLHDSLERLNNKHNYFKGKIGIRDIRRLIRSASYLIEVY